MSVIVIKLKRETYIFQEGNVLELDAQIQTGIYQNEITEGYLVPDTGKGEPGILPVAHVRTEEKQLEDETEYFGKCVLTHVVNYKDPAIEKAPKAKEINGEVKFNQVEIIHYPDCQQLVFHMPEYAWDAHELCLFDKVKQEEIFRMPVRNKLNGSTMIVLDTLTYKPGFYRITASWQNGWTHELHFIKMIPGFPFEKINQQLPADLTVVQNDEENNQAESKEIEIQNKIRHRQETLNKIQQKQEMLETSLYKRVAYFQDGRGGTIKYSDRDITISFGWEFAGGNGLVIIFITETAYWEASTKTPLSERDEILEFVALSVIRDKAPGCIYEIYENFIDIKRY